MKKLLAMCVVCMMLVMSFAQVSFALNVAEAEEFAVQGIKDELDIFNADAAAGISYRPEQLAILEAAKANFEADPDAYDWDSFVDEVEATVVAGGLDREDKVWLFMELRYFQQNPALIATYPELVDVVADFEAIDAAYSLADIDPTIAKDTLNTYTDEVTDLYETFRNEVAGSSVADLIAINNFINDPATVTAVEEYMDNEIKESAKTLLHMMFTSTAEEFELEYDALRGNDVRLKHIALYFKPFADADISLSTLKTAAREYIEENRAEIQDEATDIFEDGTTVDESVEASYDLLRKVVHGAYDKLVDVNGAPYDPEIPAWLDLLFGEDDPAAVGAIEAVMEEFDPTGEYQNLLANLSIRKGAQMTLASGMFTTESASSSYDENVIIKNGSIASFIIDVPERINIDRELPTIPNKIFNIEIECDDPDYNNNVTYDEEDGKFTVTRNSKLGSTYEVTITVYRAGLQNGNNIDSYIESYIVPVKNPSGDSGRPVSSNTVNVTLNAGANGSIIGETRVAKGSSPKYTAVPNPGYGVDKITINGVEITDYIKDGVNAIFVIDNISANTVVNVTFIKLLNDKDSYAYIAGYPDGEFKPDNNLTREETATIFYRILSEEMVEKFKTTKSAFADVEDSRWSSTAINTLANKGILQGYPDGTFAPAGTITRAEFAAIAYRFYNMEYKGADLFSDIVGHWANNAINAVASNNWIKGYADGTFGPDKNITRAEAVTIVNRILNRSFDETKFDNTQIEFSDCVKNDWHYLDVMESSTGNLIR